MTLSFDESIDWIHSRLQFGSRPGLDRVIYLLEKVDNPHTKIKSIHFAGTNGKGSTLTFSRTLFQAAGLTVGSFTSPYITSFNERICIDGNPIPDNDLTKLVNHIKPLVDEMDTINDVKDITEFEILTVMMFLYFAEKNIDIALIEVGLGGLLDSTNVISPLVSVITTIGLDHTEILGDTLELIAIQKGGIIKPATPVVIGNVPEAAITELDNIAKKNNSTIYQFNVDYGDTYKQPRVEFGEAFDFWSQDYTLRDIQLSLMGKHQTENASVALETFKVTSKLLNITLSDKEIRSALFSASWSGRLEVLSKEPMIILDGAHNPHGITSLVETVKTKFKQQDVYIIFSAIATKNIQEMMSLLEKIPNVHIYVTTFEYPKALSSEAFQNLIPQIEFVPSWKEALALILHEMSEEDIIFITGSLYFISQVRNELLDVSKEGEIE